MIVVENIGKTYGKKDNKFVALKDVNFEIKQGSTVAIVGKSGSGKSTLMHIISGLDHPSTGAIKINGKVLHDMRPKKMDAFRANEMSFIFQAFFVEPNQTVYQNVMLPLEIAKVGRQIRKGKVLKALEAVGLSDKIQNKAVNLSGGQKQRLAIARSIVNQPQLIFADEPTGNLDSSTGDAVVKLLFDLNKKIGCTLIIVTHDEELAQRCGMQIRLKDGKIESITQKRQGKK
jgi:putative ABC transport system ATP-binding protein